MSPSTTKITSGYVFSHCVTCTPMSITVLFTVAQLWHQPKCPSVGRIENGTAFLFNQLSVGTHDIGSKIPLYQNLRSLSSDLLPKCPQWWELRWETGSSVQVCHVGGRDPAT